MSWTARWTAWRQRSRAAAGDGRALDVLRQDFVAIDIETTGLDPRRDAVVALAAIPFEGGTPADGFETLVNPGRPIPAEATRIHGITDRMVVSAPPVEEVLARLERVWASRIVVGHGVAFDLAVLTRLGRACGQAVSSGPVLCARQLATALHPGGADWTLEALGARLGVPVVGRHTARGDALTAGALLLGLLPELQRRGYRTIADLVWLQRTAAPRR